jgi:hypothetical protein
MAYKLNYELDIKLKKLQRLNQHKIQELQKNVRQFDNDIILLSANIGIIETNCKKDITDLNNSVSKLGEQMDVLNDKISYTRVNYKHIGSPIKISKNNHNTDDNYDVSTNPTDNFRMFSYNDLASCSKKSEQIQIDLIDFNNLKNTKKLKYI